MISPRLLRWPFDRSSGLLSPLLVGMALIAAGCVSPGENAAEVIVDVPYDLLGPASTTTEPPPEDITGRFELELYFLAEEDDSLWLVSRAREQSPGIQEALVELVAGPTEAESALLPVRARLSDSLNPVANQPTGGLLSITVADEAQFRESPNARLATQVLVCTMTQFPNVDAIQLRDTSGPIPLSDIDSQSIGDQARSDNYNDCLAGDLADLPLLDPDNPEGLDGEVDEGEDAPAQESDG